MLLEDVNISFTLLVLSLEPNAAEKSPNDPLAVFEFLGSNPSSSPSKLKFPFDEVGGAD